MGIFSEIERLINERGSSAKLKERILFLKQKHAAFQEERITHKTKIAELGTQVRQLENEIMRIREINKKLEFVNSQLKNQLDIFQYPDPEEHACGHCGSKQIKQTGSKSRRKRCHISLRGLRRGNRGHDQLKRYRFSYIESRMKASWP